MSKIEIVNQIQKDAEEKVAEAFSRIMPTFEHLEKTMSPFYDMVNSINFIEPLMQVSEAIKIQQKYIQEANETFKSFAVPALFEASRVTNLVRQITINEERKVKFVQSITERKEVALYCPSVQSARVRIADEDKEEIGEVVLSQMKKESFVFAQVETKPVTELFFHQSKLFRFPRELCSMDVTKKKFKIIKNIEPTFTKTKLLAQLAECPTQEAFRTAVREFNRVFKKSLKIDADLIVSTKGKGYRINPIFKITFL